MFGVSEVLLNFPVAELGAETKRQNCLNSGDSAELGSHQTCSAYSLLTQPSSSSGQHRPSVWRDRVTLSQRGYLVIWDAILEVNTCDTLEACCLKMVSRAFFFRAEKRKADKSLQGVSPGSVDLELSIVILKVTTLHINENSPLRMAKPH